MKRMNFPHRKLKRREEAIERAKNVLCYRSKQHRRVNCKCYKEAK